MTVARALVRLTRDGALPEDDVMNVIHYKGGTGTALTAADAQALANGVAAGYGGASVLWGSQLTGGGSVQIYNVSDSPPRVPAASATLNITSQLSADCLPAEVAVCVSFQAVPISGVPQARRRGRLFIGPLGKGFATHTAGNADARVDATRQAQVRDLLNGLTPITGVDVLTWNLAVYSATADAQGATVNDAAVVATNGWVDNTFDTQRRRGARTTARLEFTVT
jgi:hypothetical protein